MASHPRRPSGQRWIKRPPRPSRPTAPLTTGVPKEPVRDIRIKPGMQQFLMSIGTGISAGIVGAILAQVAGLRPGMPGFAAGACFCLGFTALWRSFGGTVQDIKDLFR